MAKGYMEEYRLTYRVEETLPLYPGFKAVRYHQMFVGLVQQKPNKKQVRKIYDDFCPIWAWTALPQDPECFRLTPEPDPLPETRFVGDPGSFSFKLVKIEHGFTDYEDMIGETFQSLEGEKREHIYEQITLFLY